MFPEERQYYEEEPAKDGRFAGDVPFDYYIALDGPHFDGLIGDAGLVHFEWPSRKVRIAYFDGVSAGHNISISPSGARGLLGNFSQQIVLLDLENMRELKRQSTFAIERAEYRLRSNTHHLWRDEKHFIGAVGDHLYEFDTDDLAHPTKLGAHLLDNAHELRWDASKRYILMGDVGNETRPPRQVAVFDLATGTSKVLKLPDTCWHVCAHPDADKPYGYAATYSLLPGRNYVDWTPSYCREYIFEIDLPTASIRRSWSSSAELPIHLNSDVGVYDNRLYIASGGGATVLELSLADGEFKEPNILECTPGLWKRLHLWRQYWENFMGAFARRPVPQRTDSALTALEVSRGSIIDGIYSTRVSPDGKYIVTGHRGFNVIAVYDRKSHELVYSTQLPLFGRKVLPRKYVSAMKQRTRLHLGMHHSEMYPSHAP
jgi:hypothetical protein